MENDSLFMDLLDSDGVDETELGDVPADITEDEHEFLFFLPDNENY